MAVYLGNNKLTFDGISEIYVGSNKVYSAAPPGPPIIDNPVNEYFCVYSANSFTIRFEKIQTASGANGNLNYNNLKLKYSTDKTNWTEVSATQGFNFNGGTIYYIYTSSAEVGTTASSSNLGLTSAAWGQVCSAPAYGYYSYTSTRMKFSGTSTIYLMGNIRTIAQGDQATPYNGYVGSKTMIDYVGMSVSSSDYTIYYTRACGLGASTRTSTYLRARGISNIQGTSNSIIDINNLFIGDHENTGTGEVSYPTFSYSTGTPYTPPYDPSEDYFYIESPSTTDTRVISISSNSSQAPPSITVYRSTDKVNWYTAGTTSKYGSFNISVAKGGRTYLKATATAWSGSGSTINIKCTQSFAVGGNIMSLIYGDDFIGKTALKSSSYGTFSSLFYQSTNLIDISNLVLPATTLINSCYSYMFYGCTGLTSIPSNLLPATTITNSCYSMMFSGCRNITKAPILPATTLQAGSYFEMFRNCSSLIEITTYANNISANNCTYNWVNGVANNGTFYKLGSASWTTGGNGIPNSTWTVKTSLDS